MITQHDFSGSVTLCSGEDRQTFIIVLNQQICCILFLFANCDAA